jgi:hypothetical protein
MDGEFADKFNSIPKYVISKTLTDPEWNNRRAEAESRRRHRRPRKRPAGPIPLLGSLHSGDAVVAGEGREGGGKHRDGAHDEPEPAGVVRGSKIAKQ